MARILIHLRDPEVLKTVIDGLAGTRHTVTPVDDLGREAGPAAAAENVLAHEADLVVMDYWPEDAAGVKFLQTLADEPGRPEFIFVESEGEIPHAEALMALNEGARALLPRAVSAVALRRYAERALSGAGRSRSRNREGAESPASARLEEQMGFLRLKNAGFQKLIAHLLAAPVSAQARKVLVVSDSPYQLEMLKKMLEEHNFAVLTAGSPADGLNLALGERPRIIVSDLELEGQTGLEFCQAVKFTHQIIPCYFVICTANQDKIAKVLTPGNGVDDCLVKPSGQSQSDTAEFISRVALGLLL